MMTRKKRETISMIDCDLMTIKDDRDTLDDYLMELYKMGKINEEDLGKIGNKLYMIDLRVKDAKKRIEEL